MRAKFVAALIATVVAGVITVPLTDASTTWRTHVDAANEFAIATPASWIWMPKTKASGLKLAVQLRARGEVHQAALVRSYLNDSWQSDPTRIFDAIAYPTTDSPIATDLVVTRRQLPSGVPTSRRTLQVLAQSLFDGLKKSSGVTMKPPKPIALSLGGRASFEFDGSSPAAGFGGRRTGFDIYLLLDARGLYGLELRTDSTYLSRELALFRQIAATARLS